ncbi:Chaperone protein HtpG [Labeo rohita]|uniref:Chaperone protein HtpG n=1 Tax=Labeo rohita TaxID=84645 RepID=A0ABQ8L906_LABRO|nr:Chaperone protein HtpG [Labeo rohita]
MPFDKRKERSDIIDTRRRGDNTKPRVIMQFTAQVICNALWKAAKKSQFLKDNNLCFAEEQTALDRERRKSLWPKVRKVKTAGKTAYYI